ncbi:hypothetical protein Pmani_034037, partial [Petrolisthes manimaculis]
MVEAGGAEVVVVGERAKCHHGRPGCEPGREQCPPSRPLHIIKSLLLPPVVENKADTPKSLLNDHRRVVCEGVVFVSYFEQTLDSYRQVLWVSDSGRSGGVINHSSSQSWRLVWKSSDHRVSEKSHRVRTKDIEVVSVMDPKFVLDSCDPRDKCSDYCHYYYTFPDFFHHMKSLSKLLISTTLQPDSCDAAPKRKYETTNNEKSLVSRSELNVTTNRVSHPSANNPVVPGADIKKVLRSIATSSDMNGNTRMETRLPVTLEKPNPATVKKPRHIGTTKEVNPNTNNRISSLRATADELNGNTNMKHNNSHTNTNEVNEITHRKLKILSACLDELNIITDTEMSCIANVDEQRVDTERKSKRSVLVKNELNANTDREKQQSP